MTHPDQDAYAQQLEKRIADLEDLVYKWKNLGAQNLFGGHGFAKIGSSFLFLGEGLQVLAPSYRTVAIAWLAQFNPTFDPDADYPYSLIQGAVDPAFAEAGPLLELRTDYDANTSASVRTATENGVDLSYVQLLARSVDLGANLTVAAGLNAVGAWVKVEDAPFWVGVLTADPTILNDGMVWYRSDTDKFRGRANSATVNFITDGDANWTDLTDGGATALHTHAGGSGHTIRENGTDQTARTGLNFIDAAAGAGLITDDAGGDETEVHLDLYLLRADANWTDLTDGGATTLHTHARTVNVSFVIDGGGSAITTGQKGHLEIPFAMTITGWTILADQSGSIVVDVWKDTYANFPPTVADTIAGTEKPTLSAAQKNQDLTLSSWTTTVSAGDVLAFNVDSAATVTRVVVSIRGTIP